MVKLKSYGIEVNITSVANSWYAATEEQQET